MNSSPRRIYLPVVGATPPVAVAQRIAAAELDEPRCIWCDRPRSRHAQAVDLGDGTSMIPACELINGGGKYPGDRRAAQAPSTGPRIRPLSARMAIAESLTLRDAMEIAGSLGEPSKMPGASYGLDAFQCRTGSRLAPDPASTCHGCYARKNFYRTWRPARIARARREAGILHAYWIEAMIAMIWHYVGAGGEPAFRWHDSGDLHGPWHLAAICAVAEATPDVRHWLPTREYDDVATFLRAGGKIPTNLTVRLSAHYIGRPVSPADLPVELLGLPTSTTHHKGEAPPIRQKGAIVCHAIDSAVNMCRKCRACWDGRVTNVSYRMH
jgi:hypothetical protein